MPEPGLWFQWDFGAGPVIDGAATWLFCAWLAWSRFRVVLAIRDKTLPTVLACIDATLRRFGGCPTYGLTDNEKTVTVDHVARIAIRNPDMVAAAGHYGLTVVTCLPADAPSKGGSEATVRVAKADLVPTDANLLADYADWAALEAACAAFCDEVNARAHRVTRRPPAEMLVEERHRLHRLPDASLHRRLRRDPGRGLPPAHGGARLVPVLGAPSPRRARRCGSATTARRW